MAKISKTQHAIRISDAFAIKDVLWILGGTTDTDTNHHYQTQKKRQQKYPDSCLDNVLRSTNLVNQTIFFSLIIHTSSSENSSSLISVLRSFSPAIG